MDHTLLLQKLTAKSMRNAQLPARQLIFLLAVGKHPTLSEQPRSALLIVQKRHDYLE